MSDERPVDRTSRPTMTVLAMPHGWKSAYVHIPFCRAAARTATFAIVDESRCESTIERYVDAVLAEIGMEPRDWRARRRQLRRGNPVELPADRSATIVDALGTLLAWRTQRYRIEVNPEDWTRGTAMAREAGVNRVSIGPSRWIDAILGVLGRAHTPSRSSRSWPGASAGVSTVSVDLIFGHRRSRRVVGGDRCSDARALDVDHISTYALTVEPGTALAAEVRDGAEPDPTTPGGPVRTLLRAASVLQGSSIRGLEPSRRRVTPVATTSSTWAHGEYVGVRDGRTRPSVGDAAGTTEDSTATSATSSRRPAALRARSALDARARNAIG